MPRADLDRVAADVVKDRVGWLRTCARKPRKKLRRHAFATGA
jgi:hypothetical protein